MRYLVGLLALVCSTTWAANYSLTLAWDASSGATSYTIYCRSASPAYPTGTTTSVGNVTSYVHTLDDGTTWYCCVTATNTSGESSCSSEITLLKKTTQFYIGG